MVSVVHLFSVFLVCFGYFWFSARCALLITIFSMPKINSDLILNEIIAGYGQRGAPPKIPGEFQYCYSNMLSL